MMCEWQLCGGREAVMVTGGRVLGEVGERGKEDRQK